MEREKKDCILRAAVKAFARFGFKKASVEEIAREAGVAKGTVYLACDSKEDLYYQALNREVRSWVAETAKLIDPRKPADQLLMSASLAGIEYLQERPLVRELFFDRPSLTLPQWTARLDELRKVGLANVIEILDLGVKQGLFRKSIDVEQTAELLHDLQIATYLFHDRPDRGAGRGERLARRFKAGFDLVLNGLLARGAAA